MLLLIIFVLIALVFSFLCSIAEAVLLSVTVGYIAQKESEGKPVGKKLRTLKEDVNKPLAAILTLNTIAHTVGAAGAGAQASVVFGSGYLGVISAVLTFLILIFSEIIPKTLGAYYWQTLAPVTAEGLRILVWLMYPFVKLSEYLTGSMTKDQGPGLKGFNREELSSMAELSWKTGLLKQQESKIVMNLLSLHDARAEDAMTPRTVVFSIPETMTVAGYFELHETEPFSRIPIYDDTPEHVNGFVLRDDLLMALARGETELAVSSLHRDLITVMNTMPLSRTFDTFLEQRSNILLVVNEYGGVEGILTLEDVLETILGVELIDEVDRSRDMQELARRFWRRRAHKNTENNKDI
jgi:CBS domain containing-hemolysin-like protein